MTFKNWVIELFKDERGYVSIKPVIAFIGCIFLCVTMIINAVLSKGLNINEALVNAVMIITAIGMGADSLDKFSFKHRYSNQEPYQPPMDPPMGSPVEPVVGDDRPM